MTARPELRVTAASAPSSTPAAVAAAWPSRLRRLALALWLELRALRLSQTAASLVFLTLLALAPVFSIVMAVLAALPVFGDLQSALQKWLSALLLPGVGEPVLRYLNQFAVKARQLSLVGTAAFFATAFVALSTIERTFDGIWGDRHRRGLAQRLTLYWTLLTVGPLLVGASLALNGLVAGELFGGAGPRGLQQGWAMVLPAALSAAALTLLYRLLPSAPVRWRDAAAGAVAAVVAMELLRRGVGLYVVRLPTYTVVYGALAVLPLLLLWLFLAWMAVLSGAVIAANLEDWGERATARRDAPPAERFAIGLAVLRHLWLAARDGAPLQPVAILAAGIGVSPTRLAAVTDALTRLGYVQRVWTTPAMASGFAGASRAAAGERVGAGASTAADGGEAFLLAPDAATRTLEDWFVAVWRAGPGAVSAGAVSAGAAGDADDRPRTVLALAAGTVAALGEAAPLRTGSGR